MSSQLEDHGARPTSVGVERALSPGSKSSARTQQSSAREPGDLAQASSVVVTDRRTREGEEPQAAVVMRQKSDEAVVPGKSAKTRVTPVESMEGRAEAEGKSAARNASPTQGGNDAFTSLRWVGKHCPLTRGGSPVREIRSPGSVRGAARKGRPYRGERNVPGQAREGISPLAGPPRGVQ